MKQIFFPKKKEETSDTNVLGIYLCGSECYPEDPGSQFGFWQQCGGISDVRVQICATQVNLVTPHFNKEVSIY